MSIERVWFLLGALPGLVGIALIGRAVHLASRGRTISWRELLMWGAAIALAISVAVLGLAHATPPLENPAPLESDVVR